MLEIGTGLTPRVGERVLDADGWRALPGLINAHDHLGLNLLPHLGKPPYESLYRFAEEIYRPDESPIRDILRADPGDALLWGAYKNLISGVTTVVHHDPFPRRVLLRRNFPVKLLRHYAWSHSLRFGEDPAGSYARRRGRPFIIHAAEGVDEESHSEIWRLSKLGMLGPDTVIIHAIALSEEDIAELERAKASVVWCPASNLRLYQRTAPIDRLRGRVKWSLGTDSTLTGSASLLDELRCGYKTGQVTPEELLQMVTTEAAKIFRLAGRGQLAPRGVADLLLLPATAAGAARDLLACGASDPGLVLASGKPRLARPAWAAVLDLGPPNAEIDGHQRWLCGDPQSLKKRIASRVGESLLQSNPLWSMLR